MILIATVAAMAALATAGIGACRGESDEDRVRATIAALTRAVGEGDAEAVCRHFVPSVKAECDGVIAMLPLLLSASEREAYAKITVGKVRIDGDRATIDAGQVKAPKVLIEHGIVPELGHLRRIDGRWLVEPVL